MTQAISRKFRNVTWDNIETKDCVNCDIVVSLDNGFSQILSAVVSRPAEGTTSDDWDTIMETIGIDAIDQATTEEVLRGQKERDKLRVSREDDMKRGVEFKKQEELFAYKLESFEIEAVKNSKDRAAKAMIRKSKSIPEVQAYTTILLMKELNNATETPTAGTESSTTTEEVPQE